MEPINFNALDLIQKFKVTGVTDPDVLDAIYRIQSDLPKLDVQETYEQAKLVQLMSTNKLSSVLTIGAHPLTLYLILGKLVAHIYMFEDTAQGMLSKIKHTKEQGYGNVKIANAIETKTPYDHILLEQSDEAEPSNMLRFLKPSGNLVIKKYTGTKEVIKITKTDKGYIREDYSEVFLHYK